MPFESGQPKLDITKEAEKLEHLAQVRLDTKNDFNMNPTSEGLAASKNLGDEWRSLSPADRTLVAHELSEKYHNRKFDTLPIPIIMMHPDGEIVGVEFKASNLDWKLGPEKIAVAAEDGKLAVGQLVPSFSIDEHYNLEYDQKDLYAPKTVNSQGARHFW